MKRRMAMLGAVTAVSGVLTMFSPTTSATAAVHNVCVDAAGFASLSSPLTYPVSATFSTNLLTTNASVFAGHPHSASFTFSFGLSICFLGGTAHATGTVHGWCGLSTGTGVTNFGNRFSWVGIGGNLVVTGDVVGLAHAEPDILGGESCVSGADGFIVTSAASLNSCDIIKLKTSQSVDIPPGGSAALSTPGSNLHVSAHLLSGGNLHLFTKVCI